MKRDDGLDVLPLLHVAERQFRPIEVGRIDRHRRAHVGADPGHGHFGGEVAAVLPGGVAVELEPGLADAAGHDMTTVLERRHIMISASERAKPLRRRPIAPRVSTR